MIASTWFLKLIMAHLLTDFILQPGSWVEDRNQKHFASPKLYLHVLLSTVVAWLFIGWQYWPVALVILISHFLIDGWKSYQQKTVQYFLIDQALHIIVISACWYFYFIRWSDIRYTYHFINSKPEFWKIACGFVFLTMPAGILIGQLTSQWRDKITGADTLANAGKWIGIAERIIILIFVLNNQYSAIGLLVAAKGIIRFNEKDRQELKTEYLVTGTLMSIALAVGTGMLIKL